jgi:hypothetical protein
MKVYVMAKEKPGSVYKSAQVPTVWLNSADQLRHAAEIILVDQTSREIAYFQAVDVAGKEAVGLAIAAPDGKATVEIKEPAPNYLPGQLLYAFALENLLKAILCFKNPGWMNESKLSKKLKTHRLADLAREADIEVFPQETSVVNGLSDIADWVGRYPVASSIEKHASGNIPLGINPDALLDWGSAHPVMRRLYDRLRELLLKSLPSPPVRGFDLVTAVRPKMS